MAPPLRRPGPSLAPPSPLRRRGGVALAAVFCLLALLAPQSPFAAFSAAATGPAEGSSPRRLGFANQMIQMGAQFVMYPEMAKMLRTQVQTLKSILKGPNTKDLKIQVYFDQQDCVVVFDTIANQENGDNTDLGLIDARSIEVLFSYGEHEGQFRYTMRRSESVQVLNFSKEHVQRFKVPRGCVGTKDSYWVAYCQQVRGVCNAGRVDIHFSREGRETDMTPVPTLQLSAFIQRRMREGLNYYQVLDWFDTPTPPHNMVFDAERCLMHFRYSSHAPERSHVSWLKHRQGVRVDFRELNGEPVAIKAPIVSGCGAVGVEDIEVAQKALEDNSFKLLVHFRHVDPHNNVFNDTVVIPRRPDIRPAQDFDYYNEEQLEFSDFFPNHSVTNLGVLGRLRMD
ncbi:conserved hypothetical protein [Neospora caninum Liverpool]|uniref:Uncharacterized protein n=1 Tax=Neospora caninum (strain Liverpool) TaxID=572307 RepID=F0V7Q8_NEOCL|nr:conserved hypothetical protein [Neospora caninum Liverpool]CBZ49749.1 conserved hypothetical protein [Neospora caninum Liverpool]CEL64333.1 TPA: hypothetical protein BN1204_002360 [Neospora caninum Liverpool]|eukprot:XP_003879784.1 conserved hypothetical protein [Neospora caninum Liverpool]